MPAKSVAQRRLMAIAEHHPSKLRGKMPQMSKKSMHDYASTKEGSLPSKVKPAQASKS